MQAVFKRNTTWEQPLYCNNRLGPWTPVKNSRVKFKMLEYVAGNLTLHVLFVHHPPAIFHTTFRISKESIPLAYVAWRNRFFGIDSWAPSKITNFESHRMLPWNNEANIRGGGKTVYVVFKYLPAVEEVGATYFPADQWDDVTFLLLLGVPFMHETPKILWLDHDCILYTFRGGLMTVRTSRGRRQATSSCQLIVSYDTYTV